MIFGSESNLIIFLMIALIALFIYHRQIKPQIKCDVDNNNDNNNNNNNNDNDNNDDNDNDNDIDDNRKRRHNKKKRDKQQSIKETYVPNMDMDDVLNVLANSTKKNKNMIKGGKGEEQVEINTEFTEMQYHQDYNDTITAINNLTPQKEIFNMGFLPVKEVTPDPNNMKKLVHLFMKKLNGEVKNNVQEYLHVNSGWNDMGKRRREKSGFEEQQEELGLPGSLYAEPAAKATVKLLRVDKTEQFNTDDQIRFIAYIIIQKPNVQDQMVLKVQFFMEREDLKGKRDDVANFFTKPIDHDDDKEIDPEQVVIIEQVFTLGYLTNQTRKKTKMDKFHDYDSVQREDGTINQEKVIKMMLKKHKERATELNSFVSTLADEDQQEIHNIPTDQQYSLYKNTRTIMDDLACFPQKSFGDRTL